MIKVFDCVEYVGEDYHEKDYDVDIKKGQIGYILDVYEDGTYEVDLILDDGIESIQVSMSAEQIKLH